IWLIAADSAGLGRLALLGFVCGLGLLMKFSFPLYVLVPLVWFASRNRGTLSQARALAAFAIPALLLALPWSLVNFHTGLDTALEAGSGETARIYKTGDILSLNAIWNYVSNVTNAGIRLYFLALALLALAPGLRVSPAGRRGLLI